MAQLPQPAQAHRFAVLDGWRGIAALGVAVYHFHAYSHFVASPFVRGSYLFVDFFFVLSGFVIAYTYGAALNRPADIAQFTVRRFGRLWPLHFAVLSVLFVLELLKLYIANRGWVHFSQPPFNPAGYTRWDALPTNFFLIQAFGLHDNLTWNGPAWSICTEFWTYLVFAALCMGGRRVLTFGAAIAIIVGYIAVAAAGKDMNVTFDVGFFRCIVGFFTGYFVFRIWRVTAPRAARWFGRCELPALVAVVLFVVYAGDNFGATFAPLLFAAVVLIFANEAGIVSRAMRIRPIAALGTRSYSIYMVHTTVFVLLSWVMMAAGKFLPSIQKIDVPGEELPLIAIGHNPFWGDWLIVPYVAAILVASALTYRAIEAPGRDYFNRIANRWRTSRRAPRADGGIMVAGADRPRPSAN